MISQPGHLKDEIHGLGGKLLDLLFPPRCVSCARVGSWLCPNCLASIRPVEPPLCSSCGKPLRVAARCSSCQAHPPLTTRVLFFGWHEGALREAIHALKYERRRELAYPLAQLLMLPITRSSLRFDLITAVPLHAQRERERGYNQAELVAQQTARLVHGSYLPTLQRTRATTDQVGLDLYARRANVQDAFAVIYPHIQKKRVLLIDDVRTTGATLDACAAALFQSGAEAVYGLTLTHPRLAA